MPKKRTVDLERFNISRRVYPAIQGGLSSTVVLEGKGYVDIHFNTELIRAVGKKMPRGVSAFDPVFMTVYWNPDTQRYTLAAKYLNDIDHSIGRPPTRYDIFVMETLPKWLIRVKEFNTVTARSTYNEQVA